MPFGVSAHFATIYWNIQYLSAAMIAVLTTLTLFRIIDASEYERRNAADVAAESGAALLIGFALHFMMPFANPKNHETIATIAAAAELYGDASTALVFGLMAYSIYRRRLVTINLMPLRTTSAASVTLTGIVVYQIAQKNTGLLADAFVLLGFLIAGLFTFGMLSVDLFTKSGSGTKQPTSGTTVPDPFTSAPYSGTPMGAHILSALEKVLALPEPTSTEPRVSDLPSPTSTSRGEMPATGSSGSHPYADTRKPPDAHSDSFGTAPSPDPVPPVPEPLTPPRQVAPTPEPAAPPVEDVAPIAEPTQPATAAADTASPAQLPALAPETPPAAVPSYPVPAIPTVPTSSKMQLKLRRTQRSSLMGKVLFILDARMEVSRDDQALVKKYKLGTLTIYDSVRRQKYSGATQALLESTHDHPGLTESLSTQALGLGKSMYRLALAGGAAAMASLSLHVTVASLMEGVHVECKDMDELLGAERAIIEAAQNLRGYIDTAQTFDGREQVLEF